MSTEERVNHPLFARFYIRASSARKLPEEDAHRRALVVGLSGRVIEVGAGNGLNFPFYPLTVERVLAVEPEPALRAAAIEAAAEQSVPITVVAPGGGATPAPGGRDGLAAGRRWLPPQP